MIRPGKSRQQLAAEACARGLLKERAAIGELAFQRLQLRRRAERLDRVRERTRAAVTERRQRQEQEQQEDLFSLDGGSG